MKKGTYLTVNRYCIPSSGSPSKFDGRFATGRICLRPYAGSSSSSASSRLRLNPEDILISYDMIAALEDDLGLMNVCGEHRSRRRHRRGLHLVT